MNESQGSGERMLRMLLIDTCGEGAGAGVSIGESVVAVEALPRGGGSAEVVEAVRRVLARAGCSLQEMGAIGVVSGPGSFTGVRVGMAAAKGLSEAARVRMVAVSRLAVLREAGGGGAGLVALDAGRGECYARDAAGREWLATVEEVGEAAAGAEVVVAEERMAARLLERGVRVRVRGLSVADARLPLARAVREGSEAMTLSDANYVWREREIYKTGSRE